MNTLSRLKFLIDYTLDGNRPGRVESSGEGTPYRGRTGLGVGGSWEYSYDANGNVTADGSRGITDISYNHANQATDIWLSEGWRVALGGDLFHLQ